MDQREIKQAVKHAIKTGNWMVRRSDDGTSYGDFQWSPIGEWTEAPDWDPAPKCGGGLHGQARQASGGNYGAGPRVEFCMTGRPRIAIEGEKIKVPRAMILLVDDLSAAAGMKFEGHLDLRGTQITKIPDDASIGGKVYGLKDSEVENG